MGTMQSMCSAFMFVHALCRRMHGFGICTPTHVYGYVHVCFECSVGFQKSVSQPLRAIFQATARNPLLVWSLTFITWCMFQEEQLEVDPVNIKPMKKLGRLEQDENWTKW